MLKKHQIENVDFLRGRRCAAVLDEQGLGKCYSIIAYLDELQMKVDHPLRVLVVCPKTITGTWRKEIVQWSDRLRPLVVEGPKKKRLAAIASTFNYGVAFITNYEFLPAIRDTKKKKYITDYKWDVVIADEMTKIKKHTTARSRAMHDFTAKSPRTIRIGLTGTPITQSPLDAFSQFKFIDPKVFGVNYRAFEHKYAVHESRYFGGARPVSKVVAFRNLTELSTKIHTVSIAHLKRNCLDLPPKSYQTIDLDFDPKQGKAYDEMCEHLITTVGDHSVAAGGVLAKLQKLQQITGGWVYGREDEHGVKPVLSVCGMGNPKLEATFDILAGASRPILIWVYFKADATMIATALRNRGHTFGQLIGGMKSRELDGVQHRFQDNQYSALICQVNVASYGLTLTAADTSVFFSQGWSVEGRVQAEDRIHRIGQVGNTHFIDLAINGSVDKVNQQVVRKKAELGQAITEQDFARIVKGEG